MVSMYAYTPPRRTDDENLASFMVCGTRVFASRALPPSEVNYALALIEDITNLRNEEHPMLGTVSDVIISEASDLHFYFKPVKPAPRDYGVAAFWQVRRRKWNFLDTNCLPPTVLEEEWAWSSRGGVVSE